jgi:hypothetical protein
MSRRSHHVGKSRKLTRNRSTTTDEALPIVTCAGRLDEVEKIVAGRINGARSSKRDIRFSEEPSCLKVFVRGKTQRQELFIYTHDITGVQDALMQCWRDNFAS